MIAIGIVAGLSILGTLVAINTPSLRDASQFEYDKLCVTQFWTNTTVKPSQLYVKSVIQERLKQRIDWYISTDDISFYDEGSEFVVSIPGDWKGRSPVVIVIKETLESIDGITEVRSIQIACA